MATSTYELIDSQVLSSSAASVTFSSIPATYRDLVLVISINNSNSYDVVRGTINSDSGSNYSYVYANGNGSSASSGSSSAQTEALYNWSNINKNGTIIVQFLDYSATNKHKTFLVRSSTASNGVDMIAGRWASTSAITSLVTSNSNNFQTGSQLHLYGIAG